MEIGKCVICHKKFYDTTTCPSCLQRYLDDLRTHNLPPGVGKWLSYQDWSEFQIISNQLGDGEISETEAKRRMERQIEATKQHNAQKAANEQRANEAAQKRRMQQKRLYGMYSTKN